MTARFRVANGYHTGAVVRRNHHTVWVRCTRHGARHASLSDIGRSMMCPCWRKDNANQYTGVPLTLMAFCALIVPLILLRLLSVTPLAM